jgi:cell fate (sporulation/competence/biofilm development) regulator YmcA (YheA/YmcA/DUF963 family)
MKIFQKERCEPDKIDKHEGFVPGWRWCKTCNRYVSEEEVKQGKHGYDAFPRVLDHNIQTAEEMKKYRRSEAEILRKKREAK